MRALVVAALVGTGLVLTGCSAPAPAPSSPAASSAAPTPSTSPTATAAPAVFTMPTQCVDAVPQSRLDEFEASSVILLGGPGGKFGDKYLADKTPEELAGGITCIWGDDATNTSSVTVSVAPITDNRAAVVAALVAQGLNEGTVGDASTFFQQGDTEHAPSILNVVRSDSWISVITTIGGPTNAQEAVDIADEVAGVVYGQS